MGSQGGQVGYIPAARVRLPPDRKTDIRFWQKRYNCDTNWDKIVQLLHKFGQNGTIVTLSCKFFRPGTRGNLPLEKSAPYMITNCRALYKN